MALLLTAIRIPITASKRPPRLPTTTVPRLPIAALIIPIRTSKQHPRHQTTTTLALPMAAIRIPITASKRPPRLPTTTHPGLPIAAIIIPIRTSKHAPRLPSTTIRHAFHTAPCLRSSSSALFNLGGLSTSREAQYLSKERGIPRTDFSPHIELIRASEVDTQRVEGVGDEVKEAADDATIRHENGLVTMTEAEYAALREAPGPENAVNLAEEDLREAEEGLKEAEKEAGEFTHKLWETREEMNEANDERNKAEKSRSEVCASIEHKNGYVTMTETQYTTLMKAAETEMKFREVGKMDSKAEKKFKMANYKLAKARKDLWEANCEVRMVKRIYGSEDHGPVQHKDRSVTGIGAQFPTSKETTDSKEVEKAEKDESLIQVGDGYVTMTEAKYSALKDEIKHKEEEIECLTEPQGKTFSELTLREHVNFWLINIAMLAALFLGVSYWLKWEGYVVNWEGYLLNWEGKKVQPLKFTRKKGSGIAESTEGADTIPSIFGSSKYSKESWTMSRFFWAADD